jgi:hypothetical protein
MKGLKFLRRAETRTGILKKEERTLRQNEEEDPHWREQQFSYEERRYGRRINEDQYEERRYGNRISIEEEDQYWSDQQNHQERRRYGRNFDENYWERGQQPRPARLDFPMFDGNNPTGWIYKVEQFFEHYHTLERQKLKLAEFHMEGEALNWFQKSEECGYFHNWKGFTNALLLRFDPMETLTRPRQTSTVTLYKIQFEVLSNRLKNLSEEYKLSCFLNGLKDDIRLPLRLLSPQNLNNTFTMAKIQEGVVLNFRRTSKFSTYTNSNWQNSKGVMDGDAKLEGGSRTQTVMASDPQVASVEEEFSEHKDQSTFEKTILRFWKILHQQIQSKFLIYRGATTPRSKLWLPVLKWNPLKKKFKKSRLKIWNPEIKKGEWLGSSRKHH